MAACGLDGLLVTHLPNIRYLTGFTGSSGTLLVDHRLEVLFTDFRYETQAAEEVGDRVSIRIARQGLLEELAGRLDEGPAGRRIGFEADSMTVRDRRELGTECGNVSWEAAEGLVESLRMVKDEHEIGRIAAAAALAARCLEVLLEKVQEGATERDLAAELDYQLRREGSEALPFETIVASGPRSALPHATPSERAVQSGDLLLVDFGARVDGYCSDMTRTFVVGAPQGWQVEIHEAVRHALEVAIASVSAGKTAREVDLAARDALEAEGLARFFGHSTGHGIGLEVHEEPRVHRSSQEVLKRGNVVTIEPGVYLPGRGGVRIEEDVLVTDGEPRVITSFPRSLIEL